MSEIEEFDINALIDSDCDELLEHDEKMRSSVSEAEHEEKKRHSKKGEGKSITLNVTEKGDLMEFLISKLSDRSRTTIKSYLTNRQVAINYIKTKQFNDPVKPGDVVTINLGLARDEFRHPMLRILYEDDDIMVVDKRYGLLTMATDRERTKTAYFILSEYLKAKKSTNRIFIVHRLDRETSGLLLFAKSTEIQHELQQNWNNNVLERRYIAVVEGCPVQDEGVIKCYLAENSAYNVYVTKNESEGELAVTAYRILKKGRDNTLLELELETGKKNQIRVHMQYIGHPIIGDRKYGGKISPIERLALHASMIRFIHPRTGQELLFDLGIPAKFNTILSERRSIFE